MDARIIVSSRGQVVIPKSLREIAGVHSGSQLLIRLRKDQVLELELLHTDISQFFGQGAAYIKAHQQPPVDVDQAIGEAVLENDQNGSSYV